MADALPSAAGALNPMLADLRSRTSRVAAQSRLRFADEKFALVERGSLVAGLKSTQLRKATGDSSMDRSSDPSPCLGSPARTNRP